MRNFYYGDSSAFKTASGTIVPTHPLVTYGKNVGGVPPYSWMIPQVAGGMALRATGDNTFAANLVPQYLAIAAFTGSGTMTASIYGLGNIIAALVGSNTFSASVTATGNLNLAATGTGTISADITGKGYGTIALTGTGTLSATASLFLNMIAAMTGSGSLSADAALVVSMLASLTGSGTVSAGITGQKGMTASMTGTGTLAGNMTAFANMIAELIGEGVLSAGISATAEMSVDLIVTGTGLTTSNVGAAVWSALASLNNEPLTMGNKLNNAASAGDPWSTELPGSYAGTEAGAILAQIQTLIDELHKVQGLDAANPATTTTTNVTAGTINVDITGDGVTSTTFTRND
jgi:hypothetical protein